MAVKKVRLDEDVAVAAAACVDFDRSVGRNSNRGPDATVVRKELKEAKEIIDLIRQRVGPAYQRDVDRLWKLISR